MRSRGILLNLALTMAFATACNTAPANAPTMPHLAAPSSSATPAPSLQPVARELPGTVSAGRMPTVVNHGSRQSNTVALSFDADMTESMLANLESGRVRSYANLAILDILQRRQIPATFFVTGMWAQRYPEATQRLADDERFELANHTFKHSAYTSDCYTLPQLPRSEMTHDAQRTFDVLEPFGGNQTRYFRFPGLCHDRAALTALAPLGVTVIDGDVVSGDPFATAAQPVVNAVLSQVRAGSVIVLHITEANAQYTDEALGPILDGLAARGLEPVRLSELLEP